MKVERLETGHTAALSQARREDEKYYTRKRMAFNESKRGFRDRV
jgi:hypothetical protein